MQGDRRFGSGSRGRGRGKGDARNRSSNRSNIPTSPPHRWGSFQRISPLPPPDRRTPRCSPSPFLSRRGAPHRSISPPPRRRNLRRSISPPPGRHDLRRSISPPPGRRDLRRSISPSPPTRRVLPRSISPAPNRPPLQISISPIPDRRGPPPPVPDSRGPPPPIRRSVSTERQRDYMLRGKHQASTAPPYGNFQQQEQYMFADRVSDLSNSRIVKDKGFIGSSSSLVQESLYMEDGSRRTFYTLPEVAKNSYDSSSALNPSSMRSIGMPRYDQLLRDPYDVTGPTNGAPSSSDFANETDLLKFYGNPLQDNGFNPALQQLSDRMMQAPLSPHGRREMDASSMSFLDTTKGRIDRGNAYGLERPRSVHRDTTMDFCDLKGVGEDYIGGSSSGYAGYGVKELREHEMVSPYDGRYRLERDAGPMDYRDRRCSPLLVDRQLDMFRRGMSPPGQKSRMDVDDYDMLHEVGRRGDYGLSDELEGRSVHRRIRSPIPDDDEMWAHEERRSIEARNVYRRIRPPIDEEDEMWVPEVRRPIEERIRYACPKKVGIRRSRIDSRIEVVRGLHLKKRLRPGSFIPERRQKSFRAHKTWKQGPEDGNNNNVMSHDEKIHVKNDPPEDSKEFKQQLHKAFLHFSKLLNESSSQQKRYTDDEGKSKKLLCCICGRLSKEFVDIDSLLCHSYHSRKVGLRTKHLGFHKALCVLNGWDWHVVPDPAHAYKRRTPSDIKVLKEDLILWPPIVIVHNSSIENKSNNEPKIVSAERMEELLKDMGFGAGKTKVSRGKAANQSVLLVKFVATFSGLQEAEKLHKYYADNNRGRQGFKQITSSKNEKTSFVKEEDVLYGYMAVAEDLDKLGPETKKRSLVKSRKDIVAIADAPID